MQKAKHIAEDGHILHTEVRKVKKRVGVNSAINNVAGAGGGFGAGDSRLNFISRLDPRPMAILITTKMR